MSESGGIPGGVGAEGNSDEVEGSEQPDAGLEPTRQRRSRVVLATVVVGVIVIGGAAAVWWPRDDSDDTVATAADGGDRDEPASSSEESPEDEATDVGPADTDSETPEEPPVADVPAEPVETAAGSFVSFDYEVTGDATVLQRPDGTHAVVLEDLNSDDGPDLYLYLSTNPADGPGDAFKNDYADLGSLQGLTGTQEYDVPADVDPARFATVVIWCEAVSAPFGAADLAG